MKASLALLACVPLAPVAIVPSALAQVTVRASVDSSGGQGNNASLEGSITPDGRFVAFWSIATDLVPGDTNGDSDVFVRDRVLGTTERVSVSSTGAQSNGDFFSYLTPSISPDGRFVTFTSVASNLVPGDTNLAYDVFVRDRQLGITERVSVGAGGIQGDSTSITYSTTPDGRFVAFRSGSSNLVPGDTNLWSDVYVRDRQLGTTERVSLHTSGAQGDSSSGGPSISADGRHVAFWSDATNLVAGDDNQSTDVFVHDRLLGTTERVSLGAGGVQGDGDSTVPSISQDGRWVAFHSAASSLVAADTNASVDVFVRDLSLGVTDRVSVASDGSQGNGSSWMPSISADGRFVAFHSDATNFLVADPCCRDVFVHDRQLGSTECVSVSSAGEHADTSSESGSISSDGRYVVYRSPATNLVPGDTNDRNDTFVRDRSGGPAFTSLCDPGSAGVIACPCSNPPALSGRGCDNSSGTGGAILAASGGAFLSSDSLVFTTSGEKPTALSIVSQWSASIATGAVFGMGVRCGAGTLKRLYTKTASGGSITAPDFGAGDPQVSARSAGLGDAIPGGQSRWYLVYYRDPIVLGGCPASSTFNATQTGRVTWSP